MTFLEKWKLDCPGNGLVDVPMGCPADYGYEIRAIPSKHEGECYMPSELRCYNCWRREIPMKEKEHNSKYNVPSRYGYWQVSTEGDEEGRSIRNLGVFHGNIDEIAFALADKVMYTLNFEAVEPDYIPVPATKEYATRINVFLCLENVSYGDSNTRFNVMREMLKDTNISVMNGPGYGTISLIRPEDPDRIKEMKIDTALSKLTDEEKELLRNYFDPSLD